MKSIILCEGSTDYILLQYYMREAFHWTDDKSIHIFQFELLLSSLMNGKISSKM